MEDSEIERFEQELRSYRFRAPKPFPSETRTFPMLRQWHLATAAIVLAVISVGLWRIIPRVQLRGNPPTVHSVPESSEGRREALTIMRLNRITGTNSKELDRLLIQVSPQVLPNVERSRGVLHSLAEQ
ncbi:MAG: hypothetical protein ACHP8A_15490 [Terriglobales bacterium]|jgi:hypothetical protein